MQTLLGSVQWSDGTPHSSDESPEQNPNCSGWFTRLSQISAPVFASSFMIESESPIEG